MALIGVGPVRGVYWFQSDGKMAKWFKDFPITLKNGTDKIRSVVEPGSQRKANKAGFGAKTGHRKGSPADSTAGGGGGVGSLLSGRNRKNSEVRNGAGSQKDGKVWDTLVSGKSRKNSKAEAVLEEMHRPPKSTPPACGYMSRMVRVDKQDKSPNFTTVSGTVSSPLDPEVEKPAALSKTETLVILEDYADPFDAQRTREQRDAERSGENDGYMEPYDAQQMITEIRRRGSKDLLKVCAPTDGSEGAAEKGQPAAIYDDPYEGSADSKKTAVVKPKLDQRPVTEYELAWEWRKEHIVRTLSAQFDSPVKEEMCHQTLTRQTQLQQHQRQKSKSQKNLRSSHPTLLPSSARCGSPDGETCCVDPSLPLEKQSWYHGYVTRQEAESQLQSCKEASFLVRNSESDNSKYSIALKTSQGCVHIIVAQTKENSYTLDQSSCVFPSIPEVVHHYCTRRLPFNGAEHMTLLHPVPRLQ
ncbi:PREDICTED: SH2 domain-containing adapter protein E-like [Cyprinodon variegatus]|nr:PREDICTED: SH2 domain-containing adapter protein E-like [Cyprinodon variegatus]